MFAAMAQANSRRHGGALKLHRGETFGEVSSPLPTPANDGKAPLSVCGTGIAVNYLRSGVAPFLAGSRRGGPRNSANRESHALTSKQVANLSAATEHAAMIGLPFTRMVTIHWVAAGVPLAHMARATSRFLDLLSKTLARHGSATAWIWVHENGDAKGGHCHLMAHVPAEMVTLLTGLQKRWLRRISGHPYRARVICSKPIGGRLGLEATNGELHAVNVGAALSYVLKGADQTAAAQFGLARLEAGGRIVGKRCGTSQNIGATARQTRINHEQS